MDSLQEHNMTNKDRERIANYAIDNKVSLEEAEEICRSYKEEAEKEKELEGAYNESDLDSAGELQEFPPGYDDEVMTPEEGKAWARYQQIQKELARLYEEYATAGEEYLNNVTEEDLEWVEVQLKQLNKQ